MHRRRDYFGEDVEVFRPERWETLRPGWEYLPFNGGPRICLGREFTHPLFPRAPFLAFLISSIKAGSYYHERYHGGYATLSSSSFIYPSTDLHPTNPLSRTICPDRSLIRDHAHLARIRIHRVPRPGPLAGGDHADARLGQRDQSRADARVGKKGMGRNRSISLKHSQLFLEFAA